jgi:hypothetical protein
MRRIAVVTVLLATLALAATADARRKPTKAERASIAAKFDVPGKCLKIFVSTVNHRWARMEFNGKKFDDPDCRPHAADGVVVIHRRHGRWKIVAQGSSFDCPVPDVPKRIVKDLKIRCSEQG